MAKAKKAPKRVTAVSREDFLKNLPTRDLYEVIRSNAIHSASNPWTSMGCERGSRRCPTTSCGNSKRQRGTWSPRQQIIGHRGGGCPPTPATVRTRPLLRVPFNTAKALRTTTWLSRPAIVELLIQAIDKIVQGRDREACRQGTTAECDIRRR
jgi:hypothetical protein